MKIDFPDKEYQSCASCYYSRERGSFLFCHRHAPRWNEEDWPRVSRTDWCGEWSNKDSLKA